MLDMQQAHDRGRGLPLSPREGRNDLRGPNGWSGGHNLRHLGRAPARLLELLNRVQELPDARAQTRRGARIRKLLGPMDKPLRDTREKPGAREGRTWPHELDARGDSLPELGELAGLGRPAPGKKRLQPLADALEAAQSGLANPGECGPRRRLEATRDRTAGRLEAAADGPEEPVRPREPWAPRAVVASRIVHQRT